MAFIDKFRHMIDILVGDEVNFPGKLSVDLFHEVREAGLESIWHVIEELGAERVGHGASAIQIPVLMDYLNEHRIGLESNLTIN